MDKQDIKISQVLKEFEKLPTFPDGRINYSHSNKAPVLTCFVKLQDKVLLLKRSKRVRVYKGKWNAVAGYLDELKPINEKALEELNEELGISQKDILHIKVNAPYEFFDLSVKKTWIVYPAVVELKRKPNIRLNWEHTDCRWIHPRDIKKYDIVPKLDESLKKVLI